MYKVKLTNFARKMELRSLLPDIDIEDININKSGVNRLALQLTGFFEHFDTDRIQLIGKVEYAFCEQIEEKKKKAVFEKIFDKKIIDALSLLTHSDDEPYMEYVAKIKENKLASDGIVGPATWNKILKGI